MRVASAAEVRASIAAHLLGARTAGPELGEIVLHPHQRDGLARVRRILEERRGVLLADDVGLGKTFVALAAAREARDAVVVAPASLRDSWISAARRAAVPVRFISIEMLSRGHVAAGDPDLIVVDEAHHFRSAQTRRFAAASAMCGGAKVILVSATPVQNRLGDLRTMLSLFLGQSALALPADELVRYIVRRSERDLPASAGFTLPRVRPPEWLRPVQDVDCLDRLLALPAPLPPSDGQDGGVLLTYTLVRQWASSRAALCAALRRRLARGRALEDALLAGRWPSRAELSAWCYADGTQQLAFPELAVCGKADDAAMLIAQVQRHTDAVRELLAWISSSPDPDAARVGAVRDLLTRHDGERVVAFSEYADTVSAFYRALAPVARVAMLTHGGGRVAGGALTRRELLPRFAPGSAAQVPANERIDLLLTTDVLSEGVNLHDASVVIHLDLAWNPARLEQRVGRLRRIGAARDTVAVYLFSPPAPAERLLGLEKRLRLKLGVAARAVGAGVAGAILPGFDTPRQSRAVLEQRIADTVAPWRTDAAPAAMDMRLAGAARSPRDAAIACVKRQGATTLIAVAGHRVTESRATILDLLTHADGCDAPLDAAALRATRQQIEQWLRRRVVSDVVDLAALHVGRARRRLLQRVETIARRAPRHSQPALAPLMRAARTAATITLSAGAERVLDELAHAPLSDQAWLHAVGEFAALHARAGGDAPEILALLLLSRE